MLAGLRWRGSWTAAPGGIAAVSNNEKFFFLPSPSFFFFVLSGCIFLVRFWFLFCFGFLLLGLFLFFSLSSGRSLSLSLFGSLGFFFSPLSLRVLSIYRKRNGAGMTFASAPSITQRLVGLWGEFGGGGGEERDAGEISKFSSSVLLKRGEGGR